MADRFDILKKILKGGSASYKVPTERPGIKAQKNAFDTFQRASSALYQQSLVGHFFTVCRCDVLCTAWTTVGGSLSRLIFTKIE